MPSDCFFTLEPGQKFLPAPRVQVAPSLLPGSANTGCCGPISHNFPLICVCLSLYTCAYISLLWPNGPKSKFGNDDFGSKASEAHPCMIHCTERKTTLLTSCLGARTSYSDRILLGTPTLVLEYQKLDP